MKISFVFIPVLITIFSLCPHKMKPQKASEKKPYKSGQVIIRVAKEHLKMSNVNNKSMPSGTASEFFDSFIVGTIADIVLNGDKVQASNLRVKKVYPKETSTDSISISIDNRVVRKPDFYECFVLGLPENTDILYISKLLTKAHGIKYAEPNYIIVPESVGK